MYEAAYRAGMAADPRGEEGVERVLAQARKEFDDLPERKRWEFDQERLVNPFADTRILNGDPGDRGRHASSWASTWRSARCCWPTVCARRGSRWTCCSPTIRKAGRSPASTRSWACRPTSGTSSACRSPTATRS